jgi:hypothetical protein
MAQSTNPYGRMQPDFLLQGHLPAYSRRNRLMETGESLGAFGTADTRIGDYKK